MATNDKSFGVRGNLEVGGSSTVGNSLVVSNSNTPITLKSPDGNIFSLYAEVDGTLSSTHIISYVGSATFAGINNTTTNVTYGSSAVSNVESGDLMLVFLSDDFSSIWATPAGWTLVFGDSGFDGTSSAYFWYKYATSSDTSFNASRTNTVNCTPTSTLTVYRNATYISYSNSGINISTPPSVSITNSNSAVVINAFCQDEIAAVLVSPEGYSPATTTYALPNDTGSIGTAHKISFSAPTTETPGSFTGVSIGNFMRTTSVLLENNQVITNNKNFRTRDGLEVENSISADTVAFNNPGDGLILYSEGGVGFKVFVGDDGSLTIHGSPARGLFGGGVTTVNVNTIDYVQIATLGNATDFGDLTVARNFVASCSSSTRGLFGSGDTPSVSNVVDHVTISTIGNALDFGDLTIARTMASSCSSSTRGIFSLGANGATYYNTIDYVTIATIGNATDFGDATVPRPLAGGFSSTTRGVFGGGDNVGFNPTIDYITIATTGNALDFGDLSVARYSRGGCASSIRGLFGGGRTSTVIDYITIATTGNATDFGDLTVARESLTGCSSSTRGLFGGGHTSPDNFNTIDYVEINTVGNATDFGDLTAARRGPAACSNAHGGLG